MAESTLSLGRTEFRKEIAHALGYGRDSTLWSPGQSDDIDSVLEAGLRQFLFHKPMELAPMHQWSFLRPWELLSTVSGTWEYGLPEDFGGVLGSFYYPLAEGFGPCLERSPGELADRRQAGDATGRPSVFAIVPVGITSGQRYAVQFWPTPDGSYRLRYRRLILPNTLTATFPIPHGGLPHTQTILQSCRAVIEFRFDGRIGLEHQKFDELLAASLVHDLKLAPERLSNMRGVDTYAPLTRYAQVNGVRTT